MSDVSGVIPSHVRGTDLLNLAEKRMSWLQKREAVLAGNVANANTPDYTPKDVSPFQGLVDAEHTATLRRTNPRHLAPAGGNVHAQKTGGLASLDGNKVVLEEEMAKIADTSDQQRFATTVYGRYMGMYGMALGGASQ